MSSICRKPEACPSVIRYTSRRSESVLWMSRSTAFWMPASSSVARSQSRAFWMACRARLRSYVGSETIGSDVADEIHRDVAARGEGIEDIQSRAFGPVKPGDDAVAL